MKTRLYLSALGFIFLSLIPSRGLGQKPELVVQTGHAASADSTVEGQFGLGGKVLVTSGRDRAIKLWDPETGNLLKTFTGLDEFDPVKISPDGKRLAAVVLNQSIRIWSLETGNEIRTLKVTPAKLNGEIPQGKAEVTSINSLSFSDDGQRLFTLTTIRVANQDSIVIQSWELGSGSSETHPLENVKDIAPGVFSPDGTLIASHQSSDAGSKIVVWNAATGRVAYTQSYAGFIWTVNFSPDGKTLLVRMSDKLVLLDPRSGRSRLTINSNRALAEDAIFSHDGQLIIGVVTTKQGKVTETKINVWEAANGNLVSEMYLGRDYVNYVSFALSPDDKTLSCQMQTESSEGATGTIRQWDVRSGNTRLEFHPLNSEISSALKVTPDGKYIVTFGEGRDVNLWDATTGAKVRTLAGQSRAVSFIEYSPDGNFFASEREVKEEYDVLIWDLRVGAPVFNINGQFQAFSRDSKMVVTESSGSGRAFDDNSMFSSLGNGDTDKEYETNLWSIANREMIARFPGEFLALSLDGKSIITRSEKGGVGVWDVGAKKLLRTLVTYHGETSFAVASRDGRYVASGWDNGQTIKIIDVASGRTLRQLTGFPLNDGDDSGAYAYAAAFSHDGRIFACRRGGLMGGETMLLWDTNTGTLLHKLKAGFGLAPKLGFAPDNRTLVSMSSEIAFYDTQTGKRKRVVEFNNSIFNDVMSADMATSSLFSPNGRYFVAVMMGGGSGLEVLDLKTNQPLPYLTEAAFKAAAFSPDSKTLALVGQDNSIQFWDTQAEKLLVTVLNGEQDDWLTVAPDGRFDGTANAWRKIFWRFGSNIFDIVPVEIFFNDFYFPNLLSDVLSGSVTAFTQNLAEKDRRQSHLSLKSSVQLDSSLKAASRSIAISAEIFDAPAGAQDVRLFRNGSLVKIWRGDVLQGQQRVTLEATVPIVAGRNNFTAYCFNHDNVKSADATLVIEGAESLKRPATLHILTIGVNRYANAAFNLKYAVADARAFAEVVKLQQDNLKEFARVEITALYDEQSTKQNILDAFARLREQVQPEDALLIYFAGHGLANEPRFYLIPHDLGYDGPRTGAALTPRLSEIYAHAFSDEELERELEGLGASMILFVIDACNSGQALEAEEKRRGPMNSRGLAQLAYEKGMYILTAAQSYQSALEAQKLGHGYLTYALIEEGLKQGKADREPSDGEVRVREWLDYATARVPEMQSREMQARELRHESLVIVEGEERKGAQQRNVQRPRVFYRREPEARPFIVARPRSLPASP